MPSESLLPLPTHVAVIMDGNGRWAQQRRRPRAFGHRAGVQAVRGLIKACLGRGIPCLTLFAFSSENWSRPRGEVSSLMDLFLRSLRKEADDLARNGVRLRFIGDRAAFADELQQAMRDVEQRTRENTRLQLNIAVNYGGRWDIVAAARSLAEQVRRGELDPAAIDSEVFHGQTSLADLPDPDLLIRTGGEQRISNFLLWQSAYAELYFCDTLWPDFDEAALDLALADFRGRQRRFGGVPGTAPARSAKAG
ncbi:MAG: di-trans,poly-cis-decaprenylcistransferase [Xanthomonadales bacterium]|nr:di-trans,poly-cis-decaprenylcistransferase [Xanthomonadales bacterium]